MTNLTTTPDHRDTTSTSGPSALTQAQHLIQAAKRPLLVCHISPDGDALGSLIGLGLALHRMGYTPTLACADPIPAHFNYLPGVATIVREALAGFDLVISLDCSDLDRLGHIAQTSEFDQVPLLNIDHHITNLNFGQVNLVDPQASSTAEIVLRLLGIMHVPLDAEIATCLLTGLVADTRGFRTNNVTTQVMEATVQLMKAGASLPDVSYRILDRRPASAIRLWGAALSRLKFKNHVLWTSIPLTMRQQVGHSGNGDASLVSFLISAADAEAAVVFVEREGGEVEISMRAVPGFNVAQVALHFGGGGHALAAGCSLPGSLEEAQTLLLKALWADLARQRTA